MKKGDTTADMFSTAAKAKPDAPALPQKGTYTPLDSVKGIPTYLERIREAIDCIQSRCDSGIRGKVFTKAQEAKLIGISQEIGAWMPELDRIRKDVEGIIYETTADDLF